MELRHLITFRTIIDVGGFKKAAEQLGYAQSSITAHIKELEKELGYPLFDRLGKKVVLTQTGERFLPYALDIIRLYTESKEVIRQTDQPSGDLTIGVSESLLIYWLPNIITAFMHQYPEVHLTVKPIDYEDLADQLKQNEIDVALLVETNSWLSSELKIHKLTDEKLVLVHPPKKETTNMLVTEYTCSWRPIIEEYLTYHSQPTENKLELPSIEAIKKCVLLGLGKSMLPQFVVKEEIDQGKLHYEKTKFEDSIAIYAAHHKDKWVSANINALLELLP
ncbi:LysR family transcriptional regulator [Gracilibacillus dipsosauri]|uniref:LysR family transcriptional regulator n=1 Tax=Gracilibacillus dipsosauri TaxID=178340 RepID=A0A317KW56_9BACI|nr:LysR family transcriptional regulator [Gracilibacillus dipsosauri]PWU66930.1 LysR family transcriptional regulator [Gracilibacillus dipsosauri]